MAEKDIKHEPIGKAGLERLPHCFLIPAHQFRRLRRMLRGFQSTIMREGWIITPEACRTQVHTMISRVGRFSCTTLSQYRQLECFNELIYNHRLYFFSVFLLSPSSLGFS